MKIDRRAFLVGSAAGMAAAYVGSKSAFAEDEIIGHGDHQFRVVPGWGELDPEKYPVDDCHAMAQDSRGRIILLNTNTKNNVIIYDTDGNLLETWGTTYPGAHGLALVEENGQDVLYITDHTRHQVIKTTIDGEELSVLDFPESIEIRNAESYWPTDIEMLDDNFFYVTDGYGTNYIVKYEQPGDVVHIFGGKLEFKTPHGICIDRRKKGKSTLLVASRESREIKRYSLDGEHLNTIYLKGARVCDIFVHGDDLYAACLNGFLLVLDKNDKVVSVPGGYKPTYNKEGKLRPLFKKVETFMHPHNVFVDKAGDVYVPQWNSEHTYPIKLARVK